MQKGLKNTRLSSFELWTPLSCGLSGQHEVFVASQATPIATTLSRRFPVLPQLIGCLLVQRQADGELLWGVIVEMETYSQDDLACHGYRRRAPSNETLLGAPGRFDVYVSYGIHH